MIFLAEIWYIIKNITLRGWLWIGGAIAVIITVISIYFYIQSFSGELLREKEARAIEHQEIINEKAEEANKAENKAQESVNRVKAVENSNFKNTNGKTADRARCEAFPESEGCR